MTLGHGQVLYAPGLAVTRGIHGRAVVGDLATARRKSARQDPQGEHRCKCRFLFHHVSGLIVLLLLRLQIY